VVIEGMGRKSSSNVHKEVGGESESRCCTKVDVVGVNVAAEALLLLAARHVRRCFALLTCLGRAMRLAGAGPTQSAYLLTCKYARLATRDRCQSCQISRWIVCESSAK
jgi:hypothetical protein